VGSRSLGGQAGGEHVPVGTATEELPIKEKYFDLEPTALTV
jgi:hypothetical protein